ncbi:uncharacterized [Tachysurus ichikawai]
MGRPFPSPALVSGLVPSEVLVPTSSTPETQSPYTPLEPRRGLTTLISFFYPSTFPRPPSTYTRGSVLPHCPAHSHIPQAFTQTRIVCV